LFHRVLNSVFFVNETTPKEGGKDLVDFTLFLNLSPKKGELWAFEVSN